MPATSFVVDVQVISYRLVSTGTEREGGVYGTIRGLAESLGLDQYGPNPSHFVYNIRVSVLEPEILSFEISKRFSELAKLDESLSALTKFLPYFPPRGAQRILTDDHAKERMRLLNSYFHVICKMEEVLRTPDFTSFFELDGVAVCAVPVQVGEIRLVDSSSTGLIVSSLVVSREFIMIALSKPTSIASQASTMINAFLRTDVLTSDEVQGQLQVWNRLPNCLLCERRSIHSFQFGISATAHPSFFGTREGRVGLVNLPIASNDFTTSITYLPGVAHAGSVTAITVSGDSVWSGGCDGILQQFSLTENQVKTRTTSNAEGASITQIVCGCNLLFIGLSTGVVNVFQISGLRLVTLLQGPFSSIVSLHLRGDCNLIVVHGGSMLDTAEGYNTVQFWDVSEVTSRGTSKLAHWGPSASPLMAACILRHSGDIAVACSNGTVNVFEPSRAEMTHRAKFIFSLNATTAPNCLQTDDDRNIFLAVSDAVQIWRLPPYSVETATIVDISTAEVCQSVHRAMSSRPALPKTTTQPVPDEDEDLHSWART